MVQNIDYLRVRVIIIYINLKVRLITNKQKQASKSVEIK